MMNSPNNHERVEESAPEREDNDGDYPSCTTFRRILINRFVFH
jgi:hypothetical protein